MARRQFHILLQISEDKTSLNGANRASNPPKTSTGRQSLQVGLPSAGQAVWEARLLLCSLLPSPNPNHPPKGRGDGHGPGVDMSMSFGSTGQTDTGRVTWYSYADIKSCREAAHFSRRAHFLLNQNRPVGQTLDQLCPPSLSWDICSMESEDRKCWTQGRQIWGPALAANPNESPNPSR